jgi:cobalt/nickel transport system ATP-binding protein
MTDAALEFRDVTVRHEPHGEAAVSGVSFSVRRGERVALVGLNGSGKTTLLMSAVGLVPHEGTILVAGVPVGPGTLARIRTRIGFLFNVPEDQLLFPKVIEDAAFGLLRAGLGRKEAFERASRSLEALGVAHLADSPLHHLSHGQKLRVALAGALSTDPELLLLDEPSAGLDPPGRRRLLGLLGGQDAAMLVATHDLEFAARSCTRFVAIDEGRVVLECTDAAGVVRLWEAADAGRGTTD